MQSRYNKFTHFLKQRYGEKVRKISVDAGFSCPNKDSDSGEGGCIFCRLDSFSKMQSLENMAVQQQIEDGIRIGKERFGIQKFIVYFQASTNTFAPVSTLRKLFLDTISYPGVIGLSISTRPDCLPPAVMHLIEELSKKTNLWVELGLQSIHNKSLEAINRGHNFEIYMQAIAKLLPLNLRVCTHLIFGLPSEHRTDFLNTAKEIAKSGIHEVKLHPMLILKDTRLEEMYRNGEIQSLAMDEYISHVCDFIERMPSQMVMQRLTAEAPKEILLEPLWSLCKMNVLNGIEQELIKRDSWQGDKLAKE